MSAEKDAARNRLLTVLPHIRFAAENAAKTGKVELGILSTDSKGSGRVVARFEFADFLSDLALALDAPPSTEHEREQAKANAFLDLLANDAPPEAFANLADKDEEKN